jgi:shikimate kinase
VVERIVLVGFMCSGKSTVGRALADSLGWDFIDFDDVIEREQGKRIADIFHDRGESHFRLLEAELTERVQDRRAAVLAPGGGWMTQPDLVKFLRPGSLIVWLRISAEAVLERDRRQLGHERPLLSVDEPLAAIRDLLDARSPFYRVADAVVETDGRDPASVAAEIAGLLGREERRPVPPPLTSG